MNEQPTYCTNCNRKLSDNHDGWPLCHHCAYEVRQAKQAKDYAKVSNKPHPKQPAIREYFVRDIRVA